MSSVNVHPNRVKWFNRRMKWVAGIVLALLIVGAAIKRKQSGEVNEVNVNIADQDQRRFLSVKDIHQILFSELGYNLEGRPLNTIDIRAVEKSLEKNPFVKDADVWVDAQNDIGIRIEQRAPILRVFQSDGTSYYLDTQGNHIPSSMRFAARVPIVNGYAGKYDEHFMDLPTHIIHQVYDLIVYCQKDDFLKDLIEQVYIKEDGTLVLTPKLGDFTIQFGAANEDMADKFSRIKTFYKEALPRIGWNNYTSLSVKFKNQVIGTKS